MTKTAIIDIDNTLWQFCDAFYEQLKKINEAFPTIEHWTGWDLWEGYCSKDDFFKAINYIHFNQHDEKYLPYPEAQGFLSTLKKEGYHITIASHRLPQTRKQTEKWLLKHDLPYDELHLSFNKTSLFDMYTSVVVDDAPNVLEKAVESGALGAGLLFPWNREYSNNGFKLFNNLNDILSHILSR